MWAVLAAFKYKCEVENIELVSVFEVRITRPRSRVSHSLCRQICVFSCSHSSLSSCTQKQQEGGGNHFGAMKTSNFFSALKDNFARYDIRPEIMEDIEDHYGCGYEDPRGRHENVAWKDFCEDVARSKEFDDSEGVAEAMAMTRGATLSYDALADVDDVYSDELQKLAAADDGYHGHYHLTDKETLMAQSRAENLAAIAAGKDLKLMQQ